MKQYLAFISYSHKDAKWGKWLHNSLESYRIPKKLKNTANPRGQIIPKNLAPIFIDRAELPTSSELDVNIVNALRMSKYLIVICSPHSAQSLWVNQEIIEFKKIHGDSNILSVIVEGEPNVEESQNINIANLECFPRALKYKINQEGELLTSGQIEPLAADIKKNGDGKRKAKIRIIAGLLGVNFDSLWQREKRRRVRKTVGFFTLMAIGIIVTVYGAIQQVNSEKVVISTLMKKGKTEINNKNWGNAYLYYSKANNIKSSLDSKINLEYARERLIRQVASMEKKGGKITSLAFSPDSKKIAIGGENGEITILDIYKGDSPKVIVQKKYNEGNISHIIFTKDNRKVISGSHLMSTGDNSYSYLSDTGIVKICDIETKKCEIFTKGNSVTDLFYDSTEKTITVIHDGSQGSRVVSVASIWDLSRFTLKKEIYFNNISRTTFMAGENKLAFLSIGSPRKLSIWDLNKGKTTEEIELPFQVEYAEKLVKDLSLTSSTAHYIYDLVGKKLVSSDISKNIEISSMAVYPSKDISVLAKIDGSLSIYIKNRLIASIDTKSLPIENITISGNGKLFATAQGSKLDLYALNTDKFHNKFIRLNKFGRCSAISNNLKFLVHKEKVIDIENRKTVSQLKNNYENKKFQNYFAIFDSSSTKVAFKAWCYNTISIVNFKNKTQWDVDNYQNHIFEKPLYAINPTKQEFAVVESGKFVRIFYKLKKTISSRKLGLKNTLKIKSIYYEKSGENLFIVTSHMIYKYNFSSKEIVENWYFGIGDILNELFMINKTSSCGTSLKIVYNNYLETRRALNSYSDELDKLNFLEKLKLQLVLLFEPAFKNITLTDTNYRDSTFDRVLAESPDGDILISLNNGNSIIVFNCKERAPIFIKGCNKELKSACFNKDLLATTDEESIYLYNINSGEIIIKLDLPAEKLTFIKKSLVSYYRYSLFTNLLDVNLDSDGISDLGAFIPLELDSDNKFIVKTTHQLAWVRAQYKNDFKKLNKFIYSHSERRNR